MTARFDPFAETFRWMDQVLGAARQAVSAPALPMDLYRTGDHYVMNVDLPGIDPGTIDVSVEDRTLTVRGERTAREEDVQWLARERATGTFVRQLTVGRGLALDELEATYADGVLTITIPVAEEAKPRRVEVKHLTEAPQIGGSGAAADADAETVAA